MTYNKGNRVTNFFSIITCREKKRKRVVKAKNKRAATFFIIIKGYENGVKVCYPTFWAKKALIINELAVTNYKKKGNKVGQSLLPNI